MAKLGQVDEAGETSLAAATAAIITARWNGARAGAKPAGLQKGHHNGNGGAHSSPSMFTPASFEPMADMFTSTSPPQPPPEPSYLDEPLPPPDDFGFSSVMSDLPFPEPFVPEAYEPKGYEPNGYEPDGYEPAGYGVRPTVADHESGLPRRVPGIPDVPEVLLPPNDPLLDPAATPSADGFELSRIATYLRDDDVEGSDERPDGFDLAAVLEAVRGVPDVRDAQLRWNSGSGHTLRIEFVDGADEGQVTREVARLLREKMGLAAQPNPPGARAGGWRGSGEATLDRSTARRGGVGASAVGTSTVVASAPVPVRPVRIPAQPKGSPAGSSPAGMESPGTQPMPRPVVADGADVTRVVLDHVQVTTLGVDATVEVRLAMSKGGSAGSGYAVGTGHGPAVDAYLVRLAATAAGDAIDQLLVDAGTGVSRGRCFVEHVAVVPFGGLEVAVVVLLLVCGSFTEQLAGSAIVAGDPRQAVVRATLSAVNRRLESLLA